MSPNSKGIVGVVFRIGPYGGKGWRAGSAGGAGERAVLLAGGDEGDKILDLGDPFGRQRLDFLDQGLEVRHGRVFRDRALLYFSQCLAERRSASG